MVSSSSTARSEMVGWMAGSKLDEMASSEHLRKPKEGQDKHGVECAGGVDGMVASAEGGNAFGQNF